MAQVYFAQTIVRSTYFLELNSRLWVDHDCEDIFANIFYVCTNFYNQNQKCMQRVPHTKFKQLFAQLKTVLHGPAVRGYFINVISISK